MNLLIQSARLSGTVGAIASKSHAHRLLIAAALSDGETYVDCPDTSEDIEATARCLRAMGCGVIRDAAGYAITPGALAQTARLRCGESGSTLRFLLPVLCAAGIKAEVYMEGRLPERPLSPLREELAAHGAILSPDGETPLRVCGRIASGAYRLPGNVSSQFVSGLLFALPLLDGGSTLQLMSPPESSGYIEMTEQALGCFGIAVRKEANAYVIPGGQRYRSPGRAKAEGDWSNAAFWLCAGAVGRSPVTVAGLDMGSAQGDRAVVDILTAFGAEVCAHGGAVTVSPGDLRGVEVDARDIPDLVPALAAVAAAARGDTIIRNAGRLRLKESDRLRTTAALVRAFGAPVTETDDGLIVHGGGRLHGAEVSSKGDHRIAMAAAVLAAACREPATILDAHACAKSYPAFFSDFERLGGETEER